MAVDVIQGTNINLPKKSLKILQNSLDVGVTLLFGSLLCYLWLHTGYLLIMAACFGEVQK